MITRLIFIIFLSFLMRQVNITKWYINSKPNRKFLQYHYHYRKLEYIKGTLSNINTIITKGKDCDEVQRNSVIAFCPPILILIYCVRLFSSYCGSEVKDMRVLFCKQVLQASSCCFLVRLCHMNHFILFHFMSQFETFDTEKTQCKLQRF